jgi:transcriptional regulator with XRE-family HTH domain
VTEWPIDWRVVVDEAIRRRKRERMTQRSLAELAGVSVPTVNAFEQGQIRLRFERVIAILEALGLFVQPSDPDSFSSFRHNARRRWEELIAPLPPEDPSRQPLGHSEQAYALEGLTKPIGTRELGNVLAHIPKSSGWTPFWVPTRPELRPVAEDGLIECWLGRPGTDRHFSDAAHSDFWQVSRDGYAYLHRGFQEDGPDNLEPGTIFDLTLPIWRTAEVLIHAANLARALGGDDDTGIHLTARYSGLEGRELINWAKPLLRSVLDGRYRARSSRVDLDVRTEVGKFDADFEHVIQSFVEPLYERFDGFQPSIELVASQVAELRRQPVFGMTGG